MSKRVESSMPTEPQARKNEISRSANPAVESHQKTLGQGMARYHGAGFCWD